ncbi:MAG TPA: EpsI family protein [Terriglobales bacterium]|nr:EpsI family protein [Terriglobales bacterium]
MSAGFWPGYMGMLALLGGTFAASHVVQNRDSESLARPLSSMAPEIAGWKQSAPDELEPTLQANSYLSRTYTKDSQQLGLLIAFQNNFRAAVSVHTPKNCLPGDGWEVWKTASAKVMFAGRPVVINQYQIYKMGNRMTVLYWYQSRDRVNANEYAAKLMLVRDGLLNGRSSGSLVRIAFPERPELLPEAFRFAEAVMKQVRFCFRP